MDHPKERPELTREEGTRGRATFTGVDDAIEEDHPVAGAPGDATVDPEGELDALHDRYLRLQAEFDNYRKRTRRDLDVARADATAEVVRAFLPVLVDLERAQAAAEEGADPAAVREGIDLVLRRFRDGLAGQGVEEIDPVGEPFDEQRMEAMTMLPSPDVPEGHVIDVFQKGLRQGDRLIEPARVVVSSGPPVGGEGSS